MSFTVVVSQCLQHEKGQLTSASLLVLRVCVSLCGAESKLKPVIVSKSEPEAKPLPASALSALHAGLPSSDPGMHVLQWAFADHLPKAWAAQ